MNALITDADLLQAARNLDPTRCWKQAVECKQMLMALLELDDRKYYRDMAKRCSVRYWAGYEFYLADFGLQCLTVSVDRDNVIAQDFQLFGWFNLRILHAAHTDSPWFLLPGNPWFAHQKALLCSKDAHYRDLWPDVTPDPVRYYPVAGEPGEFETRG